MLAPTQSITAPSEAEDLKDRQERSLAGCLLGPLSCQLPACLLCAQPASDLQPWRL